MDWDKYIENMNKIEKILKDMGLSQDERNAWYLRPNLVFRNQAPIDLICDDEADTVISHLITLAQGNVG